MLRKMSDKQARKIETREDAIKFATILAKTHIVDDDILEEARWQVFSWAGLLSIKGLKNDGVWSDRVALFINNIVDLIEKQQARFEADITL